MDRIQDGNARRTAARLAPVPNPTGPRRRMMGATSSTLQWGDIGWILTRRGGPNRRESLGDGGHGASIRSHLQCGDSARLRLKSAWENGVAELLLLLAAATTTAGYWVAVSATTAAIRW